MSLSKLSLTTIPPFNFLNATCSQNATDCSHDGPPRPNETCLRCDCLAPIGLDSHPIKHWLCPSHKTDNNRPHGLAGDVVRCIQMSGLDPLHLEIETAMEYINVLDDMDADIRKDVMDYFNPSPTRLQTVSQLLREKYQSKKFRCEKHQRGKKHRPSCAFPCGHYCRHLRSITARFEDQQTCIFCDLHDAITPHQHTIYVNLKDRKRMAYSEEPRKKDSLRARLRKSIPETQERYSLTLSSVVVHKDQTECDAVTLHPTTTLEMLVPANHMPCVASFLEASTCCMSLPTARMLKNVIHPTMLFREVSLSHRADPREEQALYDVLAHHDVPEQVDTDTESDTDSEQEPLSQVRPTAFLFGKDKLSKLCDRAGSAFDKMEPVMETLNSKTAPLMEAASEVVSEAKKSAVNLTSITEACNSFIEKIKGAAETVKNVTTNVFKLIGLAILTAICLAGLLPLTVFRMILTVFKLGDSFIGRLVSSLDWAVGVILSGFQSSGCPANPQRVWTKLKRMMLNKEKNLLLCDEDGAPVPDDVEPAEPGYKRYEPPKYTTPEWPEAATDYTSDEEEQPPEPLEDVSPKALGSIFTSPVAIGLGVLSALVLGSGTLSGGMVTHMLSAVRTFSMVTKSSDDITRTLSACTHLMPEFIQSGLKWLYPKKPILETEEFSEWWKELCEVVDTYRPKDIMFNAAKQCKVRGLYNKSEEYMLKYATAASHTSPEFAIVMKATKKLEELMQTVRDMTGYSCFRNTPFCLYLWGQTRIGKSVLAQKIARQLAPKGIDINDISYTRCHGSQFWDCYCGQFAVVFDDFFTTNDETECHEFMQCVSTAQYAVPMAALDNNIAGQKGTLFSSEMVLVCSNAGYPSYSTQNNGDALLARRHMFVEVGPDDRFSDTGGGVDWDKAMVDPQFYKGSYAKFRLRDPMENNGTCSAWLTYPQLVREISAQKAVHDYKNAVAKTTILTTLESQPSTSKTSCHIQASNMMNMPPLPAPLLTQAAATVTDSSSPRAKYQLEASQFQRQKTEFYAKKTETKTQGKKPPGGTAKLNQRAPAIDDPLAEACPAKTNRFRATSEQDTNRRQQGRNMPRTKLGRYFFNHSRDHLDCPQGKEQFFQNPNNTADPETTAIVDKNLPKLAGASHTMEEGLDDEDAITPAPLQTESTGRVTYEVSTHGSPLVSILTTTKSKAELEKEDGPLGKMKKGVFYEAFKKVVSEASDDFDNWIESSNFKWVRAFATVFSLIGTAVGLVAGLTAFAGFAKRTKLVSKVKNFFRSDETDEEITSEFMNEDEEEVMPASFAVKQERQRRKTARPDMKTRNVKVKRGVRATSYLSDLRDLMKRNMVAVKVGAFSGHAMVVTSTVLMFPQHYCTDLLVNPSKHIGETITVRTSGGCAYVEEFDSEKTVTLENDDGSYRDLMFYRFSNKLPACPSIMRHFVKQEDLKNLNRVPNAFGAAFDGENINFHHGFHASLGLHSGKFKYMDPHKVREYSIVDYFHHTAPSQEGTCGTILGTSRPVNNRALLGMFTAGNYSDDRGKAEIVTYELLREVTEAVSPKSREHMIEGCVSYAGLHKSQERPLMTVDVDDHCEVLAVVSRDMMVHQPKTSMLIPSPIYEGCNLLQPHETEPSILYAGDPRGNGEDPLQKGFQKYVRRTGGFPESLIDEAFEGIRDEFYRLPMDNYPTVLCEEEVINGNPHTNMEHIDMTTSAGFPYCKRKKFQGKDSLFEGDWPQKYVSDQELEMDIRCRWNNAYQGRQSWSIWVACLKDERRALEKVTINKTKVFCYPSVAYTIVGKRLFGAFLSQFYKHHNQFSASPGMNPWSREWDEMIRTLCNVSDVGFDLDYSNFGGSIPCELVIKVVDFINGWYERFDPNWKRTDNRARHTVASELYHCTALFRNVLVRLNQGQPDGGFMTVVVNCLVNMCYMRMAFLTLMPVKWSTNLHFDEFVCIRTFGDDLITSVVPILEKYYNIREIAMFLAPYGIIVTDAKKSRELKDTFTPVKELQYLKCTSGVDRFGQYVPKFEENAVKGMLNWCRRGSPDIEADTYVQCNNALSKLYFHGERTYMKWHKELTLALQDRCHIDKPLHQYRYFDKFYGFYGYLPEIWAENSTDLVRATSQLIEDTAQEIANEEDNARPEEDVDPPAEAVGGAAVPEPVIEGKGADILADSTEEQGIKIIPPSKIPIETCPDSAWEVAEQAERWQRVESKSWTAISPNGFIIANYTVPWDLIAGANQTSAFERFTFWRGTTTIRVSVQGTPITAGQLCVMFVPLMHKAAAFAHYTNFRQNWTMIGHFFLDASCSEKGTMTISFFHPQSYLNYEHRDEKTEGLGTLMIGVMNKLRPGENGVANLNLQVFSRFEHSVFKIPAYRPPDLFYGDRKEALIQVLSEKMFGRGNWKDHKNEIELLVETALVKKKEEELRRRLRGPHAEDAKLLLLQERRAAIKDIHERYAKREPLERVKPTAELIGAGLSLVTGLLGGGTKPDGASQPPDSGPVAGLPGLDIVMDMIGPLMAMLDRPNLPADPSQVILRPFPNLANNRGSSAATMMAPNPGTLYTAPTDVLPDEDSTSLVKLMQISTLDHTGDWAASATSGTLLLDIALTPGRVLGRKNAVPVNELINPTLLEYLTLPFSFWTGSLVFSIQVVSTVFHSGCLYFGVFYGHHDPPPTSQVDASSTYGAYLELSGEKRSWKIKVPYRAATHSKCLLKGTDNITSDGLRLCQLGRAGLYVYLPLRHGSAANTVEVNVFIAGGPDFRVHNFALAPIGLRPEPYFIGQTQVVTSERHEEPEERVRPTSNKAVFKPSVNSEGGADGDYTKPKITDKYHPAPPELVIGRGAEDMKVSNAFGGDDYLEINDICRIPQYAGTLEFFKDETEDLAFTAMVPMSGIFEAYIPTLLSTRERFENPAFFNWFGSLYAGWRGTVRVWARIRLNQAAVSTDLKRDLWAWYIPCDITTENWRQSSTAELTKLQRAKWMGQVWNPLSTTSRVVGSYKPPCAFTTDERGYLFLELPSPSIYNFIRMPVGLAPTENRSMEFNPGFLQFALPSIPDGVSHTDFAIDLWVAAGDSFRFSVLQSLPQLRMVVHTWPDRYNPIPTTNQNPRQDARKSEATNYCSPSEHPFMEPNESVFDTRTPFEHLSPMDELFT